jgi:hypothetical protein
MREDKDKLQLENRYHQVDSVLDATSHMTIENAEWAQIVAGPTLFLTAILFG